MTFRTLLLFLMVVCFHASAQSAESKYALLIGVTKYEHAQMNRSALKYPEADATSVGALLRACGYEVDLLLGEQATLEAAQAAIQKMQQQGNADGIVLVGLFGHGVEYTNPANLKESGAFFGVYDTGIRTVTDSQGREILQRNGLPRLEPDPRTMLPLRDVLVAFSVSPAGRHVILADCCREDPSAARGRSSAFGSSLSLDQLPPNTSALFACSKDEQAFEHDDWGHGAFTKGFLDSVQKLQGGGEVNNQLLAYHIGRTVDTLVPAKANGRRQTVNPLNVGNFDLMLSSGTRPNQITNRVGMQLKLIPAGEFMMGSKLSPAEIEEQFKEYGAKASVYENEHPQHRVEISKPYYMGVHEVTVGQFRQFVAATGYQTDAETDGKGGYGFDEETGDYSGPDPKYTWRRPGYGQTDDHPVVNVTWHDAQAFCGWLNRTEQRTYRLPTEAEWEYACRAGTSTLYQHGDDPEGLARVGNVGDGSWLEKNIKRLVEQNLEKVKKEFPGENSDTVLKKLKEQFHDKVPVIKAKDGHAVAAPVGSYRANAFGLYDLHGNVWEWCQDWYGEDYYASSPTQDPQGPLSGSSRVLRGGSWDGLPVFFRSAFRLHDAPDYRGFRIGFRVVCD